MKLESTITTLTKVKEAKEKMAKEAKEIGMDSADITNTELSCISALLSDIAMSLAIIADHFMDKKGDLK
jgi:hypothetical protein